MATVPPVSDDHALRAMLSVLQAADAAEARGDAEEAHRIIAEHPFDGSGRAFWRPSRVRRLLQLVLLAPSLPRWATSRWILAQAQQMLQPAARSRCLRAVELAIEVRGGRDRLPGFDDVDARARVIDHDWVYRQLYLYELGGLAFFLHHVATRDLVAGADRIHDWARAPLRALRLSAPRRGTSVWTDLATGEDLDVLELGAALQVELGECVLGRVVPIDGGRLFEGTPMFVPDDVAVEVAGDPSAWLSTLRRALPVPRPEGQRIPVVGLDHPLLSDVPDQAWPLHVLASSDSARPPADWDDWSAEALACVRRHRAWPDEEVPILAAMILQPPVYAELVTRIGPGDAGWLRELGGRVEGPAAAVCCGLAVRASERAA